MNRAWLDANVLLRFITKDPPDAAGRAQRLFRRAERGELELRIPWLVVAEVVWVLHSYYQVARGEIAAALGAVLRADGVKAEEAEVMVDALELMADRNVDLVDAYLSLLSARTGEPVASFDKDFVRLGVEKIAL